MKLELADVVEMIQKEVDWCLENSDQEPKTNYQVGFIKGLRQAQSILRVFEFEMEEDVECETGNYPSRATERDFGVCSPSYILSGNERWGRALYPANGTSVSI